jgi:BASS family bile acid:Na+ symporter
MKLVSLIEKFFWIILIAGILLGLFKPVPGKIPQYLPALILGTMLFLVFLKINALEILERMKNMKLMLIVASLYMIVIPLLFFAFTRIFNYELALGLMLLTAMPAGVSTPALADILKGNISLAMSIVIVTQMIAPFTVPLLFLLVGVQGPEINKLQLLKDIAVMVFVPLIVAQVAKRYFRELINRSQQFLTSANVFLLFAFVYIAISSQSDVILDDPASLIWKTLILYAVFVLLHALGYFIFFRHKTEDRITLAVTLAYMNNGLAIVLASSYFTPGILVLMVLSEIPWNTLLAPFRRVVATLKKE